MRHPGVFNPKQTQEPPPPDISQHHMFQNPITEMPPPPRPTGQAALPSFTCKVAVFDLETRHSADEVGGWQNIDKMGMSCGVVYDSVNGQYYTYEQQDAHLMVDHLMAAQLIVGFNQIAFDNVVLHGLTGRQICDPHQYNLDLMASIQQQVGHRVSLDSVAEATLNRKKSADGLQALKWWKEGRLDEIKDYCRQDVEVTLQILNHGFLNGYVNYIDKRRGFSASVQVDWRRIIELST